jgi:YHS domain-containing protein
MKKLMAVALVAMFLMPVAAPQIFAAKETAQTGIVDAGNKLCPVSGDPVSGTNFVVYQGKRYGLCCPMCEKPFLSDPAKYIAKMEKQETAGGASKATAGMKMKMG